MMREALVFAIYDERSERELELLAIAAAYHDAGYLEGAQGHEARGAAMALAAMQEQGGFSESEQSIVKRMILDTEIVPIEIYMEPPSLEQHPHSDMSAYLLDADLSNLGRDDFFERMALLCKERAQRIEELYPSTIRIMEQHRWLSAGAKAFREKKREENLAALREKLAH